MWKLLIASAALSSNALAFAGNPAARPTENSPNFVLVTTGHRTIPVARVYNNSIDALSMKDTAPSSPLAEEEDGRFGLNGMTLYGYENGRLIGTGTVDGVEPSGEEGEEENVRLTLHRREPVAETSTIYTTRQLPRSFRALPRQATGNEKAAGMRFVREILASRRIPQAAWSKVIGAIEIKPISVQSNEEVLIITSPDSVDIGGRVLGFFLIAEQQPSRTAELYQLTMARVHWGSAVCGETSWKFLEHADVDADGTDELIYRAMGWESWRYWILRRHKGKWAPAGIEKYGESAC